MELTWLALSSLVLVGVGYAFVQKAQRSRLLTWVLVCTSLFVLATRDLFRNRERANLGLPGIEAGEGSTADANRTASEESDSGKRDRPTLFARLLRKVADWLT